MNLFTLILIITLASIALSYVLNIVAGWIIDREIHAERLKKQASWDRPPGATE